MDFKKLSNILRLNALSCLFFGGVFAVKSGEVSLFLSESSSYDLVILIVGIGLFLNGLHLVGVSLMTNIPKLQVNYFIVGDVLWVLSTIVLLSFSFIIETNPGRIASLLVASLVGAFAYFQYKESSRIWADRR